MTLLLGTNADSLAVTADEFKDGKIDDERFKNLLIEDIKIRSHDQLDRLADMLIFAHGYGL